MDFLGAKERCIGMEWKISTDSKLPQVSVLLLEDIADLSRSNCQLLTRVLWMIGIT